MSAIQEQPLLAEVARGFDPGALLLRAWPLPGGVSAQVIAFEVAFPDGHTRRLVLRRHGDIDLAQNPRVAGHEFRLLEVLHAAGLAVPQPICCDESGDIFPTPYIVVAFVEGETVSTTGDLDGHLQQMSAFLAELHNVDLATGGLPFLRRADPGVASRLSKPPAKLDVALNEGRIRDTLVAAWPLHQINASVLLHGDYWPGNVLWKGGRVAAVIDWEDAGIGDPLADLGNARLEILWAFGADAMHQFTECYLKVTQIDIGNLPCWDLYAALRPIAGMASWGIEDDKLRSMRERHTWFTSQAFERISADTA